MRLILHCEREKIRSFIELKVSLAMVMYDVLLHSDLLAAVDVARIG